MENKVKVFREQTCADFMERRGRGVVFLGGRCGVSLDG